jgi:UDP-glucose 4-epimerase
VVDNLSTGYRENVPVGAGFYELDLSGDDFAKQLPAENYTLVAHLAAQSSGEISFDDPAYDLRTNCQSTVLLLDWCLERGIERFLYTSSMSIYGDVEAQPVREDAVAKPKSFYGIGKLASEAYLGVYEGLGIKGTSLRLFNVYGPGQNLANLRQGMVSIYLAYLLRGEELVIKGATDRYRDLIYIDDVIDAYMACLAHPVETAGKAYNVGTGVKTTVAGLRDGLIRAFGRDPATYPVRLEEATLGDTFGIYSDCGKLTADTGWAPGVSLVEGLETMVAWARETA